MTGRLGGKVAVITGAASVIGKATAGLFVADGAKVRAADVTDEFGHELQQTHPDDLIYLHTDVTREPDVAAAGADVVATVQDFLAEGAR